MFISRGVLTRASERNAKLSVILSVILTVCTAAYTQSINDDLKPKAPEAKPKAAAKSPAKSIKKSPSQKKSTNTTVKTSSPPVSSETAEQILDRYMRFSQSSTVSDKDWNRVFAQAEKTLTENPNHSIAKAQRLIAQGHIALNSQQNGVAINQFKAASQMLPASSLPYYSLGRAYLANGQAKASEDAFNNAIAKNKNFALAYKGLGDAFTAQGQKEKGAKSYKKATELAVREGSRMP